MQKYKILNKTLCIILVLSVSLTTILLFTDVIRSNNPAEAANVKQGSTGATVKQIQQNLKSWGYYNGIVDGIFGSQTSAAVKYFQKTHGLTADGVVGTQTANALGITLTSNTGTSSSNAYLLARVVYGEARGEPYVGQVAIASIILNRVKSSQFPNTISGVVYQKGAFDVVSDGQINMTPNDTAIRAAQDAMNGWDPTYGCLFYYNPSTATNAWIKQKPIHLTIGRHVFCV